MSKFIISVRTYNPPSIPQNPHFNFMPRMLFISEFNHSSVKLINVEFGTGSASKPWLTMKLTQAVQKPLELQEEHDNLFSCVGTIFQNIGATCQKHQLSCVNHRFRRLQERAGCEDYDNIFNMFIALSEPFLWKKTTSGVSQCEKRVFSRDVGL